MSGFTVAKASSAAPGSADELATLIAEASGKPVNQYNLTELAGPNHAIQILADIPTWLDYAATTIFGGFVGQFGAEPATKLINFIKSQTKRGTGQASSSFDAEAMGRAIAKVAKEHKDTQTLTMAIPMQSIGSRNLGLELSGILTGDQKHDSLTLLRGAVALIALSQRMQRSNLIPMSPQNQDCSISVQLQEDGTFGGAYEMFAQPRVDVPPAEMEAAGLYGPGRYRLTLRFDAGGECIEDHVQRIANH